MKFNNLNHAGKVKSHDWNRYFFFKFIVIYLSTLATLIQSFDNLLISKIREHIVLKCTNSQYISGKNYTSKQNCVLMYLLSRRTL